MLKVFSKAFTNIDYQLRADEVRDGGPIKRGSYLLGLLLGLLGHKPTGDAAAEEVLEKRLASSSAIGREGYLRICIPIEDGDLERLLRVRRLKNSSRRPGRRRGGRRGLLRLVLPPPFDLPVDLFELLDFDLCLDLLELLDFAALLISFICTPMESIFEIISLECPRRDDPLGALCLLDFLSKATGRAEASFNARNCLVRLAIFCLIVSVNFSSSLRL